VTASSSGASLTLTSKATGASTNYSLSASSSTSQGSYFSQPSFTATATSSTLLGGRDATYSTLYDAGTVSITVNGVTKSASYGQNSTLSGLASSLASAFNGDSGAPVTASTSGATVNLTTRVTGASTNYSLSTTSSTSQSAYFSHPSFSGSASGSTLTGGQDAGANINDTGTVSITVNGFTKSTSYGQTSTASSIASALITAFNADSSSPVNTSVSGGTVTLTAKSGGAATNYTLSASSLTNQGGFTGTSFPASTSGANLTGGANSSQTPTTPYSVTLTFMPNGNVATSNDNVNGNWVYKYDDFNRLTCSNLASNSTCQTPTNGTPTYTYDYDRFGNRWHQNGPWSSQLGFDANNRITGITGVGYDAAGNMASNGSGPGTHQYFYDAESRIIQVDGTLGNCSTATACYVYDGDGRRIRKTVRGTSTDFLYDLGGHVVAEMSSTGVWNRGEIFAAGRHIATYNNSTTYFIHADWLGTERVRTQVSGSVCETTASLPFGDVISTSGSCQPSPNFFTSKERDAETASSPGGLDGLDYFGARYNASNLGRFMSPDWSRDPDAVPYADFRGPQSLNLYSYVRNNPLNRTDPDGHKQVCTSKTTSSAGIIHMAVTCHDEPDFTWAAFVAWGHHFVDRAIIRNATNTLSGKFFDRWKTGPLQNTGLHRGFSTAHRLNSAQIRDIIQKVETETGRAMSNWTQQDIETAVDEARSAGGDVKAFTDSIAQNNPNARTLADDIAPIMEEAKSALKAVEGFIEKEGPALEEVIENIEQECAEGGCIPPL